MFSNMKYLLEFSFIFNALAWIWGDDSLVVTTEQGRLRGSLHKSRNGTEYRQFLGIPYAKPPVGQLRFQPPQSPDSWTGERNATIPPPKCLQKPFYVFIKMPQIISGEEDCLYLNVYTPSKIHNKSGLPVMVYIHGGSFTVGSGIDCNPKYFLDHQIIVVNFNYRLGVLGFLSAGDEILPGNYGLKDQVAALKWVKQNIAHFGGDPQRVTLFGESSGASSTHLHMHSPLSKGLFHQAISQSGTALAIWAQSPVSVARQKFHALAYLAGCRTGSTQTLVDCLRNIPATELVQVQHKLFTWDLEPMVIFSPVVEPASVKSAFLIEDAWKQKELSNLPWMVGIVSGEGILKAARYLSNGGKLVEELNTNYKHLLPVTFFHQNWVKLEDSEKTAEIIKKYYFGEKDIGNETSAELVNLMGDAFFASDSIEAARRYTSKSYVYYYDHQGEKSFAQFFGNYKKKLGVCHGDDIISLFAFPTLSNLSPVDLKVSERMVNYWINFAYEGNPTSDNSWHQSKSSGLDYLHIMTKEDRMEKDLLLDRYNFWKNLSIFPSLTVNEEVTKKKL